ncbi:MAG: bifunctional [glutamate--ammonia ligase]-adenylyl-L-tyrosine phosphorylase/[glutamate--ammonia-ligase] adenylyltransferase [Pseudomonadota bacterium]
MWNRINKLLAHQSWYANRPELQHTLRHWYSALSEIDTDAATALATQAASQPAYWRAAAASTFVRDAALQEPASLGDILTDSAPETVFDRARLDAAVAELGAERGLRRFRRQLMLKIAWRDAADALPLADVLEALSAFANAAVEIGLKAARARLRERHGELRTRDGGVVPLQVVCMGKLGGGELNFSSDIDIFFVYPEIGESDGRRALHAEEYCLRQARLVIDILDRVTELGRVFRVDTRLRPFGSAGPLAISLDALEVYLQRHGRDWERYAFVKARVIGEDPRNLTRDWVADCLTRFVYRAYLDFGVLQSLRDMQRTIEQEATSQEAVRDIKRGTGGIREIEFIVQSWQLIRGGRLPALQTTSLYEALEAVAAAECISAKMAAELRAAYDYLRVLENRLQGLADRQTHSLPESESERHALVLSMGKDSWDSLVAELDVHRQRVSDAFRGLVFAAAENDAQRDSTPDWLSIDRGQIKQSLSERSLGQIDTLAGLLQEFARRMLQQPLTEAVQDRIRGAVNAVIVRLPAFTPAPSVLERALKLVESVCRRSAYLVLLVEQPEATDRLLRLLASSRFIAEQLAEQPMLLDELLDASLFNEPMDIDQMRTELEALARTQDESDVEHQTDALVRFVRTAQFRIAVADVSGVLEIMRVSDRLSNTATVVLERTLTLAWNDMVARHGRPAGTDASAPGFAVIGYGKLGGLELGYGSDLDIVFLHDLDEGETDGPTPLDNARFAMRLARRMVHLLSVQTGHGKLYEVDMRLRPSGRSGLLVSSLAAFRRYQQKDAWTWEHQALVRARAVAGDAGVMRSFEQIRRDTLVDSINRASLRVAVADMRRRMRENLSRSGPNEFDLKQDPGGIADLEFLVQYLILQHAHTHIALLEWTDNIRQLDSLAGHAVLTSDTATSLQEAYVELRATVHRMALEGNRPVVPSATLQDVRRRVSRQWQYWLGSH